MCVPGEGIVFPSKTWHATPLNRNSHGMKRVVLFGAIGPSSGPYANELNSKTLNIVLFPHSMARRLEEPGSLEVTGDPARLNADQIYAWLEEAGFDMGKCCWCFTAVMFVETTESQYAKKKKFNVESRSQSKQ